MTLLEACASCGWIWSRSLHSRMVCSRSNSSKSLVTPYCVFAELVSETVCLRSDSCWLEILFWARRASYWEFLISGFDCGTLDNLNEEPRSVLQDGSVSSKALQGEMAWQLDCVCAWWGAKG